MKPHLPLILLTGLLSAGVALGDSATPTNNAPTVLQETVIIGHTAAKSLTSPSAAQAEAEKAEVPGAFTIKNADDMKTGRASNFQDLLQNTPGVFLQSENGVEASKISVRGSGILSDEEPVGVTFLLDGLNFTEGDGEATLENFDVGTLKYAEVYRGADALKYGSLMLGGAINLVPYTGYDADPFRARLELGSYGYARSQISGGGVDGPVDYYGSLMGRYRDGYRDHSRENTGLFFTDAGYKITDTMENRIYVTVDETSREIPGGLTKEQMNSDPRAAGEGAIDQNFSDSWNFFRIADKLSIKTADCEVNAGGFWYHVNQYTRDLFSADAPDGIQEYNGNNFGLLFNTILHGELLGRQNILTIGITPEYEDENPRNFANDSGQRGGETAAGEGRHLDLPLYAQDQFYLTKPLSLLTGLQLIYVRRQYIDDLDSSDSHIQNFYGVNPKVGVIYEFNEKNQCYLNFSRSWQPPSLDNSLRFTGGGGSPEIYVPLKPQSAWTVETGTRGEHGRFSWDLALYHSWVHDELLELNNASGESLGASNVPRSEHQGIEAGLDTELLHLDSDKDGKGRTRDQLTFKQTYTLTDCHFIDNPVYADNRIAGIPVHLYQASLLYQAACGFYAGPDIQCNLTSYPVDQANTLYVGSYALLGAKMGYQWRKLLVFVEAKNLTDQRYPGSVDVIADARTEPDPDIFHPGDGRSFYGGVSWAW